MPIIPRTAWDQSKTQPTGLKSHTDGKITNIVIHHTQTPNEAAEKAPGRIASIRRTHTEERGWKDIAYHYFIAPDGKLYKGRDDRFQADTGAPYPLDGTLTVTLLGDFRETLPSEAARETLVKFIRWQLGVQGLKPSAVSTHGRKGNSTCPGAKFQTWLDETGKARFSD
ncbi:MAG: N-acetylmuramoyl-L-alanine amidase [Luteolibacter sp.]